MGDNGEAKGEALTNGRITKGSGPDSAGARVVILTGFMFSYFLSFAQRCSAPALAGRFSSKFLLKVVTVKVVDPHVPVLATRGERLSVRREGHGAAT